MKVTLGWLREFVPIDLSVEALCERLSTGGLEIEGVEERGAEIRSVIVGEIVSTAPHPNADRLTLCQVRTSAQTTVPVVCGATNMGAGDRVAYAPPGAVLPGGRTIERTEIRGQLSEGMLCSEAELGISAAADGILILASDAPLGERVGRWLKIEDVVLDVGVAPNRGDCLSVFGLAREIAVLTGSRLLRPRLAVRERGESAARSIAVRIEDPAGCARYAARVLRGVRIGPSPRWLQQRLSAVGLRPINNVVDVTNFVMIERGQPLHAFDLDRLPRPEVVVRRAGATKGMETLDGTMRALAPEDLLITTGAEPIAVAGVMGGASTEVRQETANVLLESAWFDPASVRRTRRRLDLPSEASYRFERGVDIAGVTIALDRAASLIRQLAGGEIAPGIVEAHPGLPAPAPIALRPKRMEEILGVEIARGEITAVLKALGAGVSGDARGPLNVVPPTFRRDLTREIDLIEEVVRVAGYDRVPTTMPTVSVESGEAPARLDWAGECKRLLAAMGLSEAIPLSFASPATNALFRGVAVPGEVLRVLNPLSRDDAEMRRSLLGGLVQAWKHNGNQGARGVALFTVGKVYWKDGGPREAWRVGGVLAGELPRRGVGQERAVELADAKGVVEAILDQLRICDRVEWKRLGEDRTFHPGKSAEIQLDGELLGVLAALHPQAEVELGVAGAHWLFELDLEKLLPYSPPRRVFGGLPRYPAVVRDLAVVVDGDFASDRVVRFVRQWRSELVEDVRLFDEYAGAPIPAGKKSLAYSISYRASERTLTDEEVNVLHEELIATLTGALPVELRR